MLVYLKSPVNGEGDSQFAYDIVLPKMLQQIYMKLKIDLQYDFEYRGFVAEYPSLPGCISQGKTKKEALKNIQEAIRGYVSVLRKHHQTAPLEVTRSSYVEVKI